MSNLCTDNRFEIIAKAKQALLDSTNIESSSDEMKALNDFLFRCWQMGWLDKYDDSKDVAEVRHGWWEKKDDPYGFFDIIPVCSECGRTTELRKQYAYCPYCGAKMDGEEQEHEKEIL